MDIIALEFLKGGRGTPRRGLFKPYSRRGLFKPYSGKLGSERRYGVRSIYCCFRFIGSLFFARLFVEVMDCGANPIPDCVFGMNIIKKLNNWDSNGSFVWLKSIQRDQLVVYVVFPILLGQSIKIYIFCYLYLSSEGRYLLVMTENFAALPRVKQLLMEEDSEEPYVIFGSGFPKDQLFTQVRWKLFSLKFEYWLSVCRFVFLSVSVFPCLSACLFFI